MRCRELLFIRGTYLPLFVGLVLVNCFVLSAHVLWSTQRWGLLLSFYLKGSSVCKDVLLEIALLDLKVLMNGPTLRVWCPFLSWKESSPSLRSEPSVVLLLDALPRVDF